MASATVGTKVAVAALRGFPITDSIVPLTADFVGPSIWLIDLFLFVGTSTISCTVFLEVTGFKVPETSDFGEFNVLDFPGIATDGLVEVDDFGVRVGKGSEKLENIFGVLLQLEGPVGESTEDRRGSGIPGNGPVSVSLDDFGGLTATDGEIKFSNGSGSFVVSKGGEQSGENGVKVDRRS